MSRVKRGNVARKRRKKMLKLAKGFQGSLSKLFRPASQALLHAGNNACLPGLINFDKDP